MIIPYDNIVRATIIMNCQMHMYTCIYIYIYIKCIYVSNALSSEINICMKKQVLVIINVFHKDEWTI